MCTLLTKMKSSLRILTLSPPLFPSPGVVVCAYLCASFFVFVEQGELMAVKQIQVPLPGSVDSNDRAQEALYALQREIDVMKKLEHPNIVKYLGTEIADGE